jgi:hypothetical protein
MQSTPLIETQAEIAYRTHDLAEQYRRSTARGHRRVSGAHPVRRWRANHAHRTNDSAVS